MSSLNRSFAFFSFLLMLPACTQSLNNAKFNQNQPQQTPDPQINLADLPLDPSKPFVNLVSVNIKPELLNEFLSLLKTYAEQTRKEPGVLRYDVHQSPHDPSVIELYESYKDTPARMAHNNSVHRIEFFTAVKERGYFKSPAVSKIVYLIDPMKE